MAKKLWVIWGIVCVLVIVTALVLMLVLVPQVKSTGIQVGEYKELVKQEYTFSGNEISKLTQQYGITQSDVNKGKQTDKFEDGNINPFTPPSEVTIYNEPTKENENGSGPLTPDSK